MPDILLKSAAIVLAGLAGWSLGRSVPSWHMDEANDHTRRHSMHPNHSYEGNHGEGGCGMFGLLSPGAGPTVIYFGGALLLVYFGWGDLMPIFSDGNVDWRPLGSLLGPAAVLYVVSRFIDRGPVGPLE